MNFKLITVFLILNQLIAHVHSSTIVSTNSKNLYPLNFIQAIKKINEKLEFEKEYSNVFHQELLNLNSTFNIVKFIEDLLKNLNINSIGFNFPNVTQECLVELVTVVDGLNRLEFWTLQMLDSFGKPSSGILEGSLFWTGEFQECRNVTKNSLKGKYCTLSKPVPLSQQQPFFLSLKYGLCVPNNCNYEDVAQLVNFVIDNLPKNITQLLPFQINKINSTYVNCIESKSLDTPAQAAIIVISVLLLMVFLGTIYDFYKRFVNYYQLKFILTNPIIENETGNAINDDEKEILIKKYQDENEPIYLKILLGFSIYTNSIKLFTISKTSDQLDCLHGIRFLSIAWVVLGHNYIFQISYSDDTLRVLEWLKRFSFMVVSNAFFSVDSFFLLSGLLTSYLFLKETSKKGLSSRLIFKYYFHRIWRITPPYMLVLMFSATLTKYLGTGPIYPNDGFEIDGCKQTWWTNLLYINNLVRTENSCLGVSWYLANDMQFHWISPLFLIPFALGKSLIGILICVAFLIANIVVTSLVINHYPGSEIGIFGTSEYFNKVYITPWCRIGPFIVGILLGYLIHYQKKKTIKIKSMINILLWLVALSTLGLMVFGIYPNFQGNPLNRVSNILYQASSRIIWAVGLGYIIYACLTSHGGFVNRILCWSIWIPLSRLSFSLYLFHTVVLLYYNSTQEHMIHMQDYNIINNFIGNLLTSLFGAYLVSMIFEVPFLAFEKLFFKRH